MLMQLMFHKLDPLKALVLFIGPELERLVKHIKISFSACMTVRPQWQRADSPDSVCCDHHSLAIARSYSLLPAAIWVQGEMSDMGLLPRLLIWNPRVNNELPPPRYHVHLMILNVKKRTQKPCTKPSQAKHPLAATCLTFATLFYRKHLTLTPSLWRHLNSKINAIRKYCTGNEVCAIYELDGTVTSVTYIPIHCTPYKLTIHSSHTQTPQTPLKKHTSYTRPSTCLT